MSIEAMEFEIEEYIRVNSRAHIYLRGKACTLVCNHVDDVRSALKEARGSEDGLRDVLDMIKVD